MTQKPYTVFFAIGDKKLRMTVLAANPIEAEQLVRKKVSVMKVEEVPLDTLAPEDSAFTAAMEILDGVMDALGGTRQPKPPRETWRERLRRMKDERNNPKKN